jgi:hypothetical protein
MTWKKCTEGRCNGIVRKHGSQGECLECGHAPPKAEPPPPCAETIDLFGSGAVVAPAVNESATSQDAAEKVDVKGQSEEVLLFILEEMERPFTDNQLVAALVARGWSHNSPRARRVDLTDGPSKRQPDGSYQRVPSRGGLLEAVGEVVEDRRKVVQWDVSDQALRWHAAVRRGRAA